MTFSKLAGSAPFNESTEAEMESVTEKNFAMRMNANLWIIMARESKIACNFWFCYKKALSRKTFLPAEIIGLDKFSNGITLQYKV